MADKAVTLIYVIITVACISACNGDYDSHLKLETTGNYLMLPLDSISRPYSKVLFKEIFNNHAFLYYLVEDQNLIIEYDLKKRAVAKRVRLKTEGPHGVGQVKGFKVINRDSLIITSNHTKLYIVNSNGRIEEKIDYGVTLDGTITTPANSMSSINQSIETEGDSILILTQIPGGNWSQLTNEDVNEFRICLRVNVKNGKAHLCPITYPKDYMREGFKGVYFSRVYNGKEFLYAFEGDRHVYVSEKNRNYKNKHEAGSEYFNTVPKNNTSSMSEYLKHGVESPRYLSLIYDRYRNVYYRLTYPGREIDDQAIDMFKAAQFPNQLSIILLDEDLRKVDELLLSKDKYLRDNYFITERGLYLSVNHPESKYLNDDSLKFELIKLVK